MTGVSRSYARTLIVAGSSANSRPAPGSNPSQRAASTRPARQSRRRGRRRARASSPGAPFGCRSSSAPPTRRSPTPSAHPAAPPHSPRPARRHVSLARARGLVRTSAKRCSRSSTPRACASSRPRSVRGDVGASGVLPGPTPLRLAVPHDNDLRWTRRHRRHRMARLPRVPSYTRARSIVASPSGSERLPFLSVA